MAHAQNDISTTDARFGYFPWDDGNPADCLQAVATFFKEHGYAVITNHAPVAETNALRAAAADIISDFHKSSSPTSTFSSQNNMIFSKNKQFLESAGKVTCFLEENQEDVRKDTVLKPAVNKIGHAMHDLNPVFESFSHAPRVRKVVAALEIRRPILAQSMYILKGARVGGVVTPHRDATFVIPMSKNPNDCLGFWWALQPATLQNGCLWVVPGSHIDGRKIRRFILSGDSIDFDGSSDSDYADSAFTPIPVNVGDLILLHGALVHKSSHNYSDYSRHAYSIHVASEGLSRDCWLQRPQDFPLRHL